MYCTTYLYDGKAEKLCEDTYRPHKLVAHMSQQANSGMSWWLFALIGGGILCLLVGVGLIFREYKRGNIPRSISVESQLSLFFAMVVFSAVVAVACFIQGFISNDPHVIHKSFMAGFLNAGGFSIALGWYEKLSKSAKADKPVNAERCAAKGPRQNGHDSHGDADPSASK
ncbi:MAG TPA: hypothetical protein VHC21_01735 [Candidatus Saccharimonadales bacterium]|nr:hypothetical protein [Candidatus Saccharimonadales bacterium]